LNSQRPSLAYPTKLVCRLGIGFLVLALSSAVVPSTLRAQAQEVDRLRDEALEEYREGRWLEARALFERVYAQRPSGEVLFLMGVSSYELRDYLPAVNYYRRALAETSRPLSAERRTTTQENLERTLRFVGVITLRISPSDAQVRITGVSATRRDGDRVEVDAGTYRVVATAAGHQDDEVAVTIRAGETQEVGISLRPNIAPEVVAEPDVARPPARTTADPVVPRAESTTPLPAEEQPTPSQSSALGASLTAVGAVLVAGGLGSSMWWRNRNSALADCAACLNESEIRGQRNAAVGITVGTLLAGATLVVIGAVTLVSRPGGDAQEAALELRLQGPSLVLNGSF